MKEQWLQQHFMIFLQLKNACTFLLAKEKTWKSIFITTSKLSQNSTEKQIMPFKTTANWLFNDIWCYLVIGCFDWKIGVFQHTVVRVFYILKTYRCVTTLWMFVIFVYVYIISRLSLALGNFIGETFISIKNITHTLVAIYFHGTGLHLPVDIFYFLFIQCFNANINDIYCVRGP